MSEKIKKEALELTDEEMDNIAGGHAAIVAESPQEGISVYVCEQREVTAAMFSAYKYGENTCPYFPPGLAVKKSCEKCTFSQTKRFGQMEVAGSYLRFLRNHGYDIVYK